MKKHKSLGLCMIVKNEEKFLEKCLSSVSDIVDEIVIVDTGSTDSTIEIAKSYNAKVYSYEWDDNFSNARNFALKNSTSDWLLLLDADETLEHESKEKLLNFINTTKLDGCHFTVRNFIGQGAPNQYTVHSAFRLLRNNKQYHYIGAIHEQIDYIKPSKFHISKQFTVLDIIINHYGYLDKTIEEKDKRKRNIPILLKELEKDPTDPFTLFNLGNEYLASKDLDNAILTYEKAYENMNPTRAYGPHLIQRMGLCYSNIERYDDALRILDVGRLHYSLCTDFVLQKANILKSINNYVAAIEHYNKCLEMEESPSNMKFSDGCNSYHPLNGLGDIYYDSNCYEKALMYYSKALQANPSLDYLLYNVADCLNKIYSNKEDMITALNKYFADPSHIPNRIILVDILIKTKNYIIGSQELNKIVDNTEFEIDIQYLDSLIKLYNKEYDLAFEGFLSCYASNSPTVIGNVHLESLKYMFIIKLLTADPNLDNILKHLYDNSYTLGHIYNIFYNVNFNIIDDKLLSSSLSQDEQDIISDFLSKLLKLTEFETFERCLQLLNKTSDNTILLLLGKIYYNNEFKGLANNVIISSIKELGAIDRRGAYILSNTVK